MAKPNQVYLTKIYMDRVIRASKSPQVQNLNQNIKYKLVTTQVTMSRTNTFLWTLHRQLHIKQSQADLVKYDQYMFCGQVCAAK